MNDAIQDIAREIAIYGVASYDLWVPIMRESVSSMTLSDNYITMYVYRYVDYRR